MENRFVVIMAGGVGSRFWPLSRHRLPKQFLDILGTGETLLQQTYRRFLPLCPKENIFVVTSAEHKDIVIEQLGIESDHVLAEPFRRNTAPCVAYSTYKVNSINSNALITVTPADHLIVKQDVFEEAINEGYRFAEESNALVTLGIKPNRPETGYGYIQAHDKKPIKGYSCLMPVKTFTEKPDLEMAKLFLESGDFYWNSGIFVWSVPAIMSGLENHMPDLYTPFDEGRDIFGTPGEDSFIASTYTKCSSISIDYGVMEKADNVFVICTDIGWSDLGTWSSLGEHTPADSDGNAIISGNFHGYNTGKNIINLPGGKLAVVDGLKDYIIVDSGDVLLLVPRENEQKVKEYLDNIRKSEGDKYL